MGRHVFRHRLFEKPEKQAWLRLNTVRSDRLLRLLDSLKAAPVNSQFLHPLTILAHFSTFFARGATTCGARLQSFKRVKVLRIGDSRLINHPDTNLALARVSHQGQCAMPQCPKAFR